jgi:hypothetical protein
MFRIAWLLLAVSKKLGCRINMRVGGDARQMNSLPEELTYRSHGIYPVQTAKQ